MEFLKIRDNFNAKLKVNTQGNLIDVNCFKMKNLVCNFNEKDSFSAIVFNANENKDSYNLIVKSAIVSLTDIGLFRVEEIEVYKEHKKITCKQIDSSTVECYIF